MLIWIYLCCINVFPLLSVYILVFWVPCCHGDSWLLRSRMVFLLGYWMFYDLWNFGCQHYIGGSGILVDVMVYGALDIYVVSAWDVCVGGGFFCQNYELAYVDKGKVCCWISWVSPKQALDIWGLVLPWVQVSVWPLVKQWLLPELWAGIWRPTPFFFNQLLRLVSTNLNSWLTNVTTTCFLDLTYKYAFVSKIIEHVSSLKFWLPINKCDILPSWQS